MLDAAIEAGADDVSSSENGHEVYASPETFREVAKALEAKFGEPRKAALTWKPHNTVPVDDETGEKLLKLIDLLERARRRPERLCQFRGLGRADGEDGRVGLPLPLVIGELDPAIYLASEILPETMDARVKPAHDKSGPFSRGMTFCFCFVRGSPAVSLTHDISADSPSRPYPRHRSGPPPHRLGRDRGRRQPAGVHRLRFGGAGRQPAAGEPAAGHP